MLKNRFKQGTAVIAAVILLLSNLFFGLGSASANSNDQKSTGPQETKAQTKLDLSQFDHPDEKVRIIIELEGSPAIEYATEQGVLFKDLSKSKQNTLQAPVKEEQSSLLSSIKKKKINFSLENTFTVVANGVSGEAKVSDIPKIESLSNVSSVYIAN